MYKFIKINRNQLLILDALLEHGGYSKKYADLKGKNIFRYSEHSGLFDVNSNKLQKIVVLGNTTRVDKGDNEIFMPNNVNDMYEYEYMFHTHPPTPKPGGRAEVGIMYELPSIGDLLHFIEHFNDGKISGSVVITSEGLYNIRSKNLNPEKIIIDEDTYNSLQESTKSFTFPSGTTTVTTTKRAVNLYQYELDLNESKRSIKLIRKDFTKQLETNLKALMS